MTFQESMLLVVFVALFVFMLWFLIFLWVQHRAHERQIAQWRRDQLAELPWNRTGWPPMPRPFPPPPPPPGAVRAKVGEKR